MQLWRPEFELDGGGQYGRPPLAFSWASCFVTDDVSVNLHLSFRMLLNLKHLAVLKIFFLQWEAQFRSLVTSVLGHDYYVAGGCNGVSRVSRVRVSDGSHDGWRCTLFKLVWEDLSSYFLDLCCNRILDFHFVKTRNPTHSRKLFSLYH